MGSELRPGCCRTAPRRYSMYFFALLVKSALAVSAVLSMAALLYFLLKCSPAAFKLLAAVTLFVMLSLMRNSPSSKNFPSLTLKSRRWNQALSRGTVSGWYTRKQSRLMNLQTSPQRWKVASRLRARLVTKLETSENTKPKYSSPDI